MKAQTSEKIRIALKKQTQQTWETYEISEEVYYKQDTDEQWKGPVNMLDQDGTVFLQHGSQFIKAHARRRQPVKSTLHMIPENEKLNKNIDQVQENKNLRSISESGSDCEMDNNNISITPPNKSNQHNDNTSNPSSLHSSSLPSTLLPPPPSDNIKQTTLNLKKTL